MFKFLFITFSLIAWNFSPTHLSSLILSEDKIYASQPTYLFAIFENISVENVLETFNSRCERVSFKLWFAESLLDT